MLTALETEGEDPISPIVLEPVITEAVDAVLGSYGERIVTIHTPEVPDLHVLASTLLVDCMENLLANGVVHNTSPNPVLWIYVREIQRDGAPFVEIAIEDNGPGIPDERKERVFDRYTRMNVRGSGLGLSLVKALVRDYGGSVWAEDRVSGAWSKGARLVMVLPRAP